MKMLSDYILSHPYVLKSKINSQYISYLILLFFWNVKTFPQICVNEEGDLLQFEWHFKKGLLEICIDKYGELNVESTYLCNDHIITQISVCADSNICMPPEAKEKITEIFQRIVQDEI